MKRVLLIGNPNTGKTSLFNHLTKSIQTTGNWAGVTIEDKTGLLQLNNLAIELIDLPGIYSLSTAKNALDEQNSVSKALFCKESDIIINMIDGASIERNLYLTMQLMDLKKPMIICINFADKLTLTQSKNYVETISKALRIPVIAISCKQNSGIKNLKKLLENFNYKISDFSNYPKLIETKLIDIANNIKGNALNYFKAIKLLEEGSNSSISLTKKILTQVIILKDEIVNTYNNPLEIVLVSLRLEHIKRILPTDKISSKPKQWELNLDKIVFGKFSGALIFLTLMFLMFTFSINFGGIFQDTFELIARAIFIDISAFALNYMHLPTLITFIISNGIGGGITTVAAFIPIITALFLFLSTLEESGYLARAAVLANGLLGKIGLPGSAFVPLIVSFGCNVPAIMAVRNLPTKATRIKTALMAPFMSCSARLTVYALFCSAFFKEYAAVLVLFLYLLGIFMALVTGLLINKFFIKDNDTSLILELPRYQWPSLKNIYQKTLSRVTAFVFGAGKTIVIIFVTVQLMGAIVTHNNLSFDIKSNSLLSGITKISLSIFKPMGINEEQWPLAASLFTGILAKEVIIGTLSAIYNQDNIFQRPNTNELGMAMESIKEAWSSLKENFMAFSFLKNFLDLSQYEFENTHLDSTIENKSLVTSLRESVHNKISIIAYLIFVLLYFPCISVYGAIKHEVGREWAIISGVWSTTIAYIIAVVFYQIAILLY